MVFLILPKIQNLFTNSGINQQVSFFYESLELNNNR